MKCAACEYDNRLGNAPFKSLGFQVYNEDKDIGDFYIDDYESRVNYRASVWTPTYVNLCACPICGTIRIKES